MYSNITQYWRFVSILQTIITVFSDEVMFDKKTNSLKPNVQSIKERVETKIPFNKTTQWITIDI